MMPRVRREVLIEFRFGGALFVRLLAGIAVARRCLHLCLQSTSKAGFCREMLTLLNEGDA
jgi:hypothetical protein